jgi:3-phosphoshikimate 1-carboxyvinyltransferase
VKINKRVSLDSHTLLVSGIGEDGLKEAGNVLDAENSATTMRLLGGLLAGQPFLSVITGDASLRSRPMGRLIEPLRLMGADIWGRGRDSFAPLVIKGKKLQGIDFTLPIPSAQIKSAILLAGLFARGDTVLRQTIPSRDHTERMLKRMGARLEIRGNSISLLPLSSPLVPVSLRVPGDISSAAYFLVAGAIHPNARIMIRGCGINPTRTGIIDILLAMGANLKMYDERLEAGEPLADIVVKSSELKGIEVGGDIVPRLIDEIPVLAVAGCVAKGKTVIRDAVELRMKESDRIATVVSELSRLGAKIESLPDGMVIYGGGLLSGTEVDSHLDHRLAMSLAIAGLIAKGETAIKNTQVAQVSYPDFWQVLREISNTAKS